MSSPIINRIKHPIVPLKRISQVDIIDSHRRYLRAGIIPYTEIGGQRYYAFGISSHNGSIFDFGGHREDSDVDLVETAVRECHEETLGLFTDSITYDDIIDNDYEVLDGLSGSNPIPTLEIFVPIHVNSILEVTLQFKQLVRQYEAIDGKELELVNIIWFSLEQLIDIYRIQHPVVFGYVRPFHTYYRIAIPINQWVANLSLSQKRLTSRSNPLFTNSSR